MPIPYLPSPMPIPVPTTPKDPYQLRDPQDWAVDQERQHHNEALYCAGEYAFFVLMWGVREFEQGRVERCSRCYGGNVDAGIVSVYNQASQARCPICFGTTFEGGWRARIVRPSLWDFSEDDEPRGQRRRGLAIQARAAVQSTSDFQVRTGDYILRGDGTRWQITSLLASHLRTGFETPLSTRAIVAFNYGEAVREDEASVAYDLPPTTNDLRDILDMPHPHTPIDFSSFEEIRAPLLPPYDLYGDG